MVSTRPPFPRKKRESGNSEFRIPDSHFFPRNAGKETVQEKRTCFDAQELQSAARQTKSTRFVLVSRPAFRGIKRESGIPNSRIPVFSRERRSRKTGSYCTSWQKKTLKFFWNSEFPDSRFFFGNFRLTLISIQSKSKSFRLTLISIQSNSKNFRLTLISIQSKSKSSR